MARAVTRERPAASRRHVLCSLTPAGRAVLAEPDDAANERDERTMRSLSQTACRTLRTLLDRVRADVRIGGRAHVPAGPASSSR